MKVCKDCYQEKSLSEFYRHPGMADGRLNKCKVCCRSYARMHRIVDHGVQKRDNERNKTPERQAHLRANSKRWIKRHPDGYRAHNAANNALRDGKLKRKPCQICGAKARVHKHHPDYSKPLDVIWLCARCHQRVHHP